MPESSKVHHVYKALLKEGHSEESAARIAQAQTGEALATGKPPKHKEENCGFENAAISELTRVRQDKPTGLWVVEVMSPIVKTWIVQGEWKTKQEADADRKNWVGQAFQNAIFEMNGKKYETDDATLKTLRSIVPDAKKSNDMSAVKAMMELGQKTGRIKEIKNSFQNGRTRALNHIMNRAESVGVKLDNAGFGSNYESREYMQGWKDGKGDEVRFQQSPYPSGIKKKDWERGWQDGYKAKHGKPNTSRMG